MPMDSKLRQRIMRDIDKRDKPSKQDIAITMCNAVLFYAERHPDRVAEYYKEKATDALEYMKGNSRVVKLSIDRSGHGFKMEAQKGWHGMEYLWLDCLCAGLPPVVTAYEEITVQ